MIYNPQKILVIPMRYEEFIKWCTDIGGTARISDGKLVCDFDKKKIDRNVEFQIISYCTSIDGIVEEDDKRVSCQIEVPESDLDKIKRLLAEYGGASPELVEEKKVYPVVLAGGVIPEDVLSEFSEEVRGLVKLAITNTQLAREVASVIESMAMRNPKFWEDYEKFRDLMAELRRARYRIRLSIPPVVTPEGVVYPIRFGSKVYYAKSPMSRRPILLMWLEEQAKKGEFIVPYDKIKMFAIHEMGLYASESSLMSVLREFEEKGFIKKKLLKDKYGRKRLYYIINLE